MHLLHRSSTRLLFKRLAAGFASLPLRCLHDRPHLDRDPAIIKCFFVYIEDWFHYQGCPFPPPPWHMREALCHYRNSRQEPLKHPPSEIAGKELFSGSVRETDHSASLHAIDRRLAFFSNRSDSALFKGELDRVPKDTGSYNGACLDLPVAESGNASTRNYRFKEQHDSELDVGSKFSRLRLFRNDSCKAFLQFVKRDLHILPEKDLVIDPGMSSVSMNERILTNDDGEVEVDAEEMPRNNTGDRIERHLLPTLANTENLAESLCRDDNEAVTLQFASKLCVNGSISLLDEKDKEGKTNEVIGLHHGDTILKFSDSSSKKRGCTPRPCERGYFTVLAKKMKNKRKRINKKSWEVERRFKLKYVSPAPPLDQIAAAGNLRMHGQASLPHYDLVMSEIIKPMVHQESSGQEVRKQVKLVDQIGTDDASQNSVLEEGLIANNAVESEKGLKEVSEDLGMKCEVFLMQDSSRGMEPNMHQRRLSLEMIGKGEGAHNKDDSSSCFQNRENLIVYDDFKASTPSGFYPKGWMNARIETLKKEVDGDVCHHAGASKVHFPLGNLSLNHLYVIFDINGVLIKRWDVNPSLPGVSKLNKKWIQLRPGCIEFLCKAFSKFKVGIWSTMTHKNVMGVCKLLEQEAHQSLPFFMLWSKDSCYQQRGVCRPNKPRVLADFKPLSHVWRFFEPYLGFHNTVLIDDSPYKACMNNPYNCIFPDPYEGCTEDNYLTDVLWPYLEKMWMSQNIEAYIANNPLGQQPVDVGHKLYYHVQQVMDDCNLHNHPSGKGELIGKV